MSRSYGSYHLYDTKYVFASPISANTQDDRVGGQVCSGSACIRLPGVWKHFTQLPSQHATRCIAQSTISPDSLSISSIQGSRGSGFEDEISNSSRFRSTFSDDTRLCVERKCGGVKTSAPISLNIFESAEEGRYPKNC